MRHDKVADKQQAAADAGDVRFELPPRFGGAGDRRLAQRAEAEWRAALAPGALMPAATALATGAASRFAAQALLLDVRRGDRVIVRHVGAAVAAAFGIEPGYLASHGEAGLAALLLDSCELLRLWQAVVPIDAALAGPASACLLTRGVLLPLAAADGTLGEVHGVLSWKQLIDPATSLALRRELAGALAADNRGFAGFGDIPRAN